MKKIKFHGQEYVFVGEYLETGGAIATEEQYLSGTCSYAHLCVDGFVRRFHKMIGARADIEVIGEYDKEPENVVASTFRMMTHPSWEGKE